MATIFVVQLKITAEMGLATASDSWDALPMNKKFAVLLRNLSKEVLVDIICRAVTDGTQYILGKLGPLSLPSLRLLPRLRTSNTH